MTLGAIGLGLLVVGAFALWWVAHHRRVARVAIMELLKEGPSYGLELVEKSRGRLRRGSVYVYLHELENEGHILSWEDTAPKVVQLRGGRPRRMYDLAKKESDA